MDGLSTAASVVAIVTIAGQSIKGITKLTGLYKNSADAVSSAATLVSNLHSLLAAVRNVEKTAIEVNSLLPQQEEILLRLREELTNCDSDIEVWLREAVAFEDNCKPGLRRWLTKAKAISKKTQVENTIRIVCSHRDQIEFLLGLLSW